MDTLQEQNFFKGIDERQAAIEQNLKCKVFPIILQEIGGSGEYVVGFAKEPDLITKLRLIDKSAGNENGICIEACSTALENLIIVSETDERIHSKSDARYWVGASLTLSQFMMMALPAIYKKK
jgi:hypothetical protein